MDSTGVLESIPHNICAPPSRNQLDYCISHAAHVFLKAIRVQISLAKNVGTSSAKSLSWLAESMKLARLPRLSFHCACLCPVTYSTI